MENTTINFYGTDLDIGFDYEPFQAETFDDPGVEETATIVDIFYSGGFMVCWYSEANRKLIEKQILDEREC